MRNPGGLAGLTLALVVGVAVISGVAGVFLLNRPLPDPATADRDALFRWLVTRDLSVEPPETRRQLALRLDEECRAGIAWGEIDGQLTPECRQRLWDNVPLLLEPWFFAKVDGYHRAPASARAAYIDGILDTLAKWKGLDGIRPTADRDGTPPELKDMLLSGVAAWKSDAGPDEQVKIDEFLFAFQARRLIRRLMGHPSPPAVE
ncbi:MAG: hypothetical protein JW809_12795 [Pirellulales bacterium]|nr:hypothetical protein [Pirellulales bacterium]